MERRCAVFLDRDGVINANRADHVLAWDEFHFLPGALKAMAALHGAGMPLVVVTNQGVLARGILSTALLDEIHSRMTAAIRAAGGEVLDVLYCPHDSHDRCGCRKPKPGMFLQAAERHNLDLARSYYVGDALTDVRAGQAAGCSCVLVWSGRGRSQVLREEARLLHGYQTATDLRAAARWILEQRKRQAPPLPGTRFSLKSALGHR